MALGFSPLKLSALIIASMVLFAVQPLAEATPNTKPVYFDLPQVTTALNHGYQATVQVTLRLPGPIAEQRARDNAIKLRHTLVLMLSDVNPQSFDAHAMDALADRYVSVANETLDGSRIREVLFQKFVVQTK